MYAVMEHDDMDREWDEATRMAELATGFAAGGAAEAQTAELAALSAERLAATTCYNCKKVGHIGRDCGVPRTAEYTKFLEDAKVERDRQRAERERASGSGRSARTPANTAAAATARRQGMPTGGRVWPPPTGRGSGGR